MRGLDAGGTEQRAQAVTDRIRQYRAERLVVRGDLVDELCKLGERRLCGAIHTGHTQLGADIHQQLVAAGRHAIGQRVGRVVRADLVEADLCGVSHEHTDGVGRLERQVVDRAADGGTEFGDGGTDLSGGRRGDDCRSRGGRGGSGRSRSRSSSGRRGLGLLRLIVRHQ